MDDGRRAVFWKPDVSHLEVGETLHVRDLYLLNIDNQIKSIRAYIAEV